jgi:hypothetical protein
MLTTHFMPLVNDQMVKTSGVNHSAANATLFEMMTPKRQNNMARKISCVISME